MNIAMNPICSMVFGALISAIVGIVGSIIHMSIKRKSELKKWEKHLIRYNGKYNVRKKQTIECDKEYKSFEINHIKGNQLSIIIETTSEKVQGYCHISDLNINYGAGYYAHNPGKNKDGSGWINVILIKPGLIHVKITIFWNNKDKPDMYILER